MPSQCSALNKTTGRRCKSRPSNPCGTCSRHTPVPPTEEELAAAVSALRNQLAITPLQPVPAEEDLANPALTVEHLEDLHAASHALWFKHPDYSGHLALSVLCKFLKVENEFTALWGEIMKNDNDRLYYQMAITDRQREREDEGN